MTPPPPAVDDNGSEGGAADDNNGDNEDGPGGGGGKDNIDSDALGVGGGDHWTVLLMDARAAANDNNAHASPFLRLNRPQIRMFLM